MPRPARASEASSRAPLSVVTYYLRNKRRVVPLLLILALAVALMVVVQSLVSSARDTAYAIFGSYQKVEVVAPRVKSQEDAYRPIAQALATLNSDHAALNQAVPTLPSDGLASLATLLEGLRQVPAEVAAGTGEVRSKIGQAAGDGRVLEADLARLAADVRSAQRQQSEQARLARLLDDAQRRPTDVAPLLDYLGGPHDVTGLTRPDTTDYSAMQADAQRAAEDANRLVADLGGLSAQLTSVSPPSIPVLPHLPGVPSPPSIAGAASSLRQLGTDLDGLAGSLTAAGGAQGDLPALEAAARRLPGVASVERDTYANLDLTMLAGNANFDLYGLTEPAMQRLLALYGDRVSTGRLPRQDRAEVALSEEVARARGVGIGGLVGSDIDELDSLPEHFRVVGLISGPTRLGFLPYDYMVANYFFSRRYQALLVIPDRGGPALARSGLVPLIKGQPYRIFDGSFVAGKIDSLLVNLQRIDDFLALVVGLTLALVIALLNNLYFRQRMNEFGLLAALGYPRRVLAGRVAREGALVVGASWVVGAALGAGVLAWFNAAYIVPHGLVLRVLDPGILLRSTLPIPVMVLSVSLGTLFLQLARLDPVAIIERRD